MEEDNNLIKPMNDIFQTETKSAIKLIKNSKGVNWEIKVVKGEEHLIEGLMLAAINTHNEILKKIEKEETN